MCLIRNPKNEEKSFDSIQTKPHHPLQELLPSTKHERNQKIARFPLMKHQQIYLFKFVMIRIKKLRTLRTLNKYKYQIQMGINFTENAQFLELKLLMKKGVECVFFFGCKLQNDC